MKTFLVTAAAVTALVLSIPSVQAAQYQGSDEAGDYAQSWSAATGGYSNGYYRSRYYRGY